MDVVKESSFPVGRVCRILRISKTAYYYKSCRDDSEVIDKLRCYAEKMPTRGFGEYRKLIRKEGIKWNHKRIKRVYDLMKLNIRRKHKRRLPNRFKVPLVVPEEENHTWSMDFMHDSLENGRKIKVLNLMDDFNQEALAIEIDSSLCGSRVKRVLQRVMEWRGKPKYIRTDNGPEFICNALVDFCKSLGIEFLYIQPGKPMQNGYVERFNRFYREDVLDAYLFNSLHEVRMLSEEWMEFYNEKHPHESLNDMSPREYLEAVNSGKLATHKSQEEFTTINSHSSSNNRNLSLSTQS
jgi:putative transposase